MLYHVSSKIEKPFVDRLKWNSIVYKAFHYYGKRQQKYTLRWRNLVNIVGYFASEIGNVPDLSTFTAKIMPTIMSIRKVYFKLD